jgi:Family of unknown function (DUF6527)
MKHCLLQHRFVHYIPEELQPGVLYVSVEFATAAHSCCCGCGEEVVTPLAPHDWQMTFDGETVSLWPSIGNWDYACRSHYVIRRNRVIEAKSWTDEQIAAGRRKDKATKAKFFAEREDTDIAEIPKLSLKQPDKRRHSILARIRSFFVRRKS